MFCSLIRTCSFCSKSSYYVLTLSSLHLSLLKGCQLCAGYFCASPPYVKLTFLFQVINCSFFRLSFCPWSCGDRLTFNWISAEHEQELQNMIRSSKAWSRAPKHGQELQSIVKSSKTWSRAPKHGQELQNMVNSSKAWSRAPKHGQELQSMAKSSNNAPRWHHVIQNVTCTSQHLHSAVIWDCVVH